MKDVIESDLPEALKILRDVKKSSDECLKHIQTLISKVKKGLPTKDGLSFLDVKNQLMVSYMANMGHLMSEKLTGHSVKDNNSVDRLVEIRTVLEKMRPIEHKLKYQINKVVNAYKEDTNDPSDPRKFKPNFGNFTNMPDEESSGDEDTGDKKTNPKKPQIYVAPKLAPVHYSHDENPEERMKKETEIKRRKSLSTTMLKELREQYTDAPREIIDNFDYHRFKENTKEQERVRYEEENFMRMTVSKKEQMGRRKMATMSALGSLVDFDGGNSYEPEGQEGAKKRKLAGKKGSKKSGKKGGKFKKKRK